MTDKNKVEATLFASGRALSIKEIAEITGLKPKAVEKALNQLRKEYSERETALTIYEQNDKWKVNVTEKYIPIVKKIVAETELERPVLETLAMIAYKTPVLQSDIIKARGVGAYEHIKELLKRGFITREQFGRSYKIKITEKFFNYFDIEGDKDIREFFKNVKKPEPKVPEKLGSLEVVPAESDEEHEKRLKQLRLQVYEVKKEQEKDKDYLKEFDKRLETIKSKIEEESSEIEKQKKDLGVKKEAEDNNENPDYENNNADADSNDNLEEKASDDNSYEEVSLLAEELKKKNYDDPEDLVKDVDKVIDNLASSYDKKKEKSNDEEVEEEIKEMGSD